MTGGRGVGPGIGGNHAGYPNAPINNEMTQGLSFTEFEYRVTQVPDLQLSWTYWNALLPETTGVAIWYLFLYPSLLHYLTDTRALVKKVDTQ